MLRKCIKSFGKFICFFATLITIFMILMILGCIFPSEMIEKNVKESSKILSKETIKKQIGFIIRDNITDSLMINEAYSVDYKEPLYSAMTVRKNYNPTVTKTQLEDLKGEMLTFHLPKGQIELIEINGKLYSKDARYSGENVEYINPIDETSNLVNVDGTTFWSNEYNTVEELEKFINGEVDLSVQYARYWHGYLPFLRVLLLFFNLLEIRVIIIVILLLLLAYLAKLLRKEFGRTLAVLFSLVMFFHGYCLSGYSIQCAPVFLIMAIASIVVMKKKDININMFMFGVGMITAYMDYLTAPLLTLGVPMIIYLLNKDEKNTKEMMCILIKAIISWGIGYALCWSAKWIIFDIIYDGEIIKIGIEQVLHRTQRNNFKSSQGLFSILKLYFEWIIVYSSLIFLMLYKKFGVLSKEMIINSINKNKIFLTLALLPLMWHIVLSNHTKLHWNFSCRDFIITGLVCLIMIHDIFVKVNKGEKNKNKKNLRL